MPTLKPIQTTNLDGFTHYGPRSGTRVRGEYLGTPFSGVIQPHFTDSGYFIELDEPIAPSHPGEFRSHIIIRAERSVRSERTYTEIIRLESHYGGGGEYRTYLESEQSTLA